MSDGTYRDIEDIKAALKAAANYLAKTPYASKDLMFVSKAIEKYLSNKQPTLDQAFGIKKGKGQYNREFDEELMKKVGIVDKELSEGKAWKTICELQGYHPNDFKKIYDRYMPRLREKIREEMADKIKYSDIDPFGE